MNGLFSRLLRAIAIYSKIEIVAALLAVVLMAGHSIAIAVKSDRATNRAIETNTIFQ